MIRTSSTNTILHTPSRREFLATGAAATVSLGMVSSGVSQVVEPTKSVSPEYRNRQSDMAYRQLGRTGMMISEVVSGGDPIRSDNYEHLNAGIERGLNYLDMAPAYGGGDCEAAYGKLLRQSGKREKVFLNTKISGYKELRNSLYKEIFDSLPAEKQRPIVERATALRKQRAVDKPGYFFEYWPGQAGELGPSYLSVAMQRDYAHRVEGSTRFREHILSSIEKSLERVGTDYFDLVMCPHGACTPEELQLTEVRETFDLLRKQGKVRFLGVSSHNDPAGVVRAATEAGWYDVIMMAYNVINGGYLEHALQNAADQQIGLIAMKVAMAVATHHQKLQPVPQWRIDKVERVVPGTLKPPQKAYVWALQNPNITAVISNLWDEKFVEENLSLAGMKVELQSA